jgi:hypothetical protein
VAPVAKAIEAISVVFPAVLVKQLAQAVQQFAGLVGVAE